MAKKGGGKKGGKKGKKGKKGAFVSDFVMPPLDEIYSFMKREEHAFVHLSLRFASLAHLDFEWPMCPTAVSIGGIKEAIRRRHNGSMATIMLYRDRVHDSCLINGPGVLDTTTLSDIGIEGKRRGGARGVAAGEAVQDEDVPQMVLYYNYPAEEFADPLLMAGFNACSRRFPPPVDKMDENTAVSKPAAGAIRQKQGTSSWRGGGAPPGTPRAATLLPGTSVT